MDTRTNQARPVNLTCEFCNREFKSERSLMRHACERKRRWQSRDEPGARLGFHAFRQFWSSHNKSSVVKTQEEFIASAYYGAFTRWGRYCVDIRAINPEAFVRWLLRGTVPIDQWCRDSLYTEYLLDYLTVESVCDALTRAIEFSVSWERDTGMVACDVLRYGNNNVLIHAVCTGRLSAWVIYMSDSGRNWLAKLRPDELALIWPYIDSGRWDKILLDRPQDSCYSGETLALAGW